MKISDITLKRITRSILAIMVVGTLCYAVIIGKIPISAFVAIATSITVFYYKKDEEDNDKNKD